MFRKAENIGRSKKTRARLSRAAYQRYTWKLSDIILILHNHATLSLPELSTLTGRSVSVIRRLMKAYNLESKHYHLWEKQKKRVDKSLKAEDYQFEPGGKNIFEDLI